MHEKVVTKKIWQVRFMLHNYNNIDVYSVEDIAF